MVESVWPEACEDPAGAAAGSFPCPCRPDPGSADAILSEEGVAALTVHRIAERADVPVGSIYQFFGDKGAVIDAVARSYLTESNAAIEELVQAAETGEGDWSDPVGRMLDTFIALYRSHPGYVALWSGRHMSAEAALIDEANTELITAGVQRLAAAQAGLPTGSEPRTGGTGRGPSRHRAHALRIQAVTTWRRRRADGAEKAAAPVLGEPHWRAGVTVT